MGVGEDDDEDKEGNLVCGVPMMRECEFASVEVSSVRLFGRGESTV